MAKVRENNSKDIYQSKVIKDEEDRVLVEDLQILDRWREYYQKLMNEENPREGRREQQAVVEDAITEITSAEIEMAIRNMKNGKQGLTLAMCPLARTHFLGGRASSGHNN